MNNRIICTIAATITALCFMSCGNAGAKNDNKENTAQTHTVVELTPDTFNSLVYDTKAKVKKYLGTKPAIVDFNATWCGPCQRIAPILEDLANEYKDQIVVYKVDVDKCKAIAESFGIRSIPAIIYIPLEDEPVMTVGARNKEKFRSEIETILLKK